MSEAPAVRIAEPHELALQIVESAIAVVPVAGETPKVVVAFSPPLSANAEPYQMRSQMTSVSKDTGNSSDHPNHATSL